MFDDWPITDIILCACHVFLFRMQFSKFFVRMNVDSDGSVSLK